MLRFDTDKIRSILKVGVPNGVENGMFQIGKLLVAGLVASFGTSSIAANAIANNIGSIVSVPATAIGLGMVTVVGRCMGAGEKKQARSYTRSLLLLAWGTIDVYKRQESGAGKTGRPGVHLLPQRPQIRFGLHHLHHRLERCV